MTRETKVGLLVGLAFIIVIGVLLSDHIQTATQPQSAALIVAPGAVDRSMVSPGAQNPGAVVARAPDRVSPGVQVTTTDSMGQPAKSVIEVAGPNDATKAADTGNPGGATPGGGPVVLEQERPEGRPTTTSLMGTDPGAHITITPEQRIAQVLGGTQPGQSPAGSSSAPASRKYTAVEGDSFSKIASKFYGGYSKAREQAFLKANPQMGGNPHKIAVGQQYVIPAIEGTPSAAPATASTQQPPATPAGDRTGPVVVNTPPPAAPKPQAKGKAYLVKEGDTLSKIASLTGTSVAELRAANKDVKNDRLRPGMTLKIPTDRVASVN